MSFGKRSRDEPTIVKRSICRKLNPRSRTSILRTASRYSKPEPQKQKQQQPLGTISTNCLNIGRPPKSTTDAPSCKHTRFYNKVVVVRIPSRYQYPDAMKQSIWASMKEIHENARRNTIEFASEGWDWRKATEDDAMYVAPNGELVHPVHVRQMYRKRHTSETSTQR